MQAFRVVACSQQQLRGGLVTNGIPRHKRGGELIDDGGDHGIKVGDLVMQLEVASSKGLQCDPIGRCHRAVVRHVRAPGRQCPDELHTGQLAQHIAESVGRADDRVLDHLQRDAPGSDCGFPTCLENTQGLDHAVTALGCDGALAGEGCMGGILGIEIVVLAPLAAIPLIRCCHFQDLDAGGL